MSAVLNAILARLGRLEGAFGVSSESTVIESPPAATDFFAEEPDSDERLVWISPATLFTLTAATGWTSQDVSAYVPDGVTRALLNVKYRVDGDAGIANIELETRQHSTASYTQKPVKFWWGPRDTNGDSAQATIQVHEQGFDYRLVHTVESGAGTWVAMEVIVELLGYWTPSTAVDPAAVTTGGAILTIPFGGTGADNAADARTNLGLAIGTNVQAYDPQLASLAALSYAGNTLKVVRVNAGETDFELATISGSGLSAAKVGARAVGSL